MTTAQKAIDPLVEAAAKNIRTVMEAQDMTRYALAKATGMDYKMICRTVEGSRSPSITQLGTIAHALNVSHAQLLTAA